MNQQFAMPAAAVPVAQPTPCLGCGAPMVVEETTALHSNPKLRCGYCRREEDLPQDAAERHRHLRLRLMQVQRARESLEAPLKTYQMLKSSFVMGAIFAGLYGAWQLSTLISNIDATERLKAAGMQTEYAQSVIFAALGPAIAFGMLFGWVGMSRVFKGAVAPLLRARPPHNPGLAARCRSCGADLPAVKAPQVTCRFCSAINLLDDSLTRDASSLLEGEIAHYNAQARGANPDGKAYHAPTRAFYVWGGASAALILVGLSAVLFMIT
jgi:hypothetical protein